jgi:hypothetical protein
MGGRLQTRSSPRFGRALLWDSHAGGGEVGAADIGAQQIEVLALPAGAGRIADLNRAVEDRPTRLTRRLRAVTFDQSVERRTRCRFG